MGNISIMLCLLGLGGLFSICGAIFDWDWFFNNTKARPFVHLFGRNGARVFYAGLGVFIIVMTLFLVAGT